MKCLNEPIARQANAEDRCTGHFWEARFHSQALRSEKALLAAMAYVDLNPVRAQLAETPEASEFTSIRARILGDYRRRTQQGPVVRMLERDELFHFESPIRALLGFSGESGGVTHPSAEDNLPIREQDYLQLVDATGRLVAAGKRGRIDPTLSPILDRIGLSSAEWEQASTAFRQHYRNGDLRLRNTA
jgi:hypothetical protein